VARFSVYLYADDVGMFVGPKEGDMHGVFSFMVCASGDATGLCTNLTKSEVFTIGCLDEQIAAATQFGLMYVR
jgi:hypothetical protein